MADRELADFNTDGHSHGCTANDVRPCEDGCAADLYAIAQDAEQALAQARALAISWECEPSPLTVQDGATRVSDYHRRACPGCSRAGSLLAALEVDHG